MFIRKSTLSSRHDITEEILQNHDRIAIAFIVLQVVGGFGLLIIFLTAIVSRSVKRYSTWYSFCISWILSSIVYSLLAIAGQRTGPDPQFGLCVTQAALIYAMPSLTACTTLSLIAHMLLNLRRLLANAAFKTNSKAIAALLVVPYMVGTGVFVGSLLYLLDHRSTVIRSPNDTYCSSSSHLLSKISSLVVVCCMLLIVVILCVIGLRLYRNRHIISGSGQSVTMVARVMSFSLLGALALGVAVAYVMTSKHSEVFDIILASLPVLAALIFGSQLDLIRIWMCSGPKESRGYTKTLSLPGQYSSVSTHETL